MGALDLLVQKRKDEASRQALQGLLNNQEIGGTAYPVKQGGLLNSTQYDVMQGLLSAGQFAPVAETIRGAAFPPAKQPAEYYGATTQGINPATGNPDFFVVNKAGQKQWLDTGGAPQEPVDPYKGTDTDIRGFMQAKERNLIPQDMTFQAFLREIKKPLVNVNTGKDEQPYSLNDLEKINFPNLPTAPLGLTPSQARAAGATLKQKEPSAESAGKMAMITPALSQLNAIQGTLFTPDGAVSPNAKNIISEAWGISKFEPMAAVSSPEAQRLYNAFEYGIQAITRTETGAAMPADEINNTRTRFMPKPWDDPSVMNQKFKAYSLFLRNMEKYLDPDKKRINIDQAFEDAAKDDVPQSSGGWSIRKRQ